MKIAFWNVGGMGPGSEKLAVCTDWIRNNDPDVLVFEEISAGLHHNVDLPGLTPIHWITTLDINGDRTTKDLALFAKAAIRIIGGSTDLPFFDKVAEERLARNLVVNDPRRDVLTATIITAAGSFLHLYGLHANSSYSGGRTAVAAIDHLIAYNGNGYSNGDRIIIEQSIIAGGDFNADGGATSAGLTKKTLPLGHDGAPLAFTQWRKDLRPREYVQGDRYFDQDDMNRYCTRTRLTPQQVAGWNMIVRPGGVIDYALSSFNLAVAAERCCVNGDEWLAILKAFDHAPAVFRV